MSKALRAVGQKYVLDGNQDPQQASPAQLSLDLPIAHLLKKFNNDDPPAEPKLVVPLSTIKKISKLLGEHAGAGHKCASTREMLGDVGKIM
jgi:hypothetical protein